LLFALEMTVTLQWADSAHAQVPEPAASQPCLSLFGLARTGLSCCLIKDALKEARLAPLFGKLPLHVRSLLLKSCLFLEHGVLKLAFVHLELLNCLSNRVRIVNILESSDAGLCREVCVGLGFAYDLRTCDAASLNLFEELLVLLTLLELAFELFDLSLKLVLVEVGHVQLTKPFCPVVLKSRLKLLETF